MSTNQYAAFYRINPATAAKGFHQLIDEGVLYKRRGIGMFVSPDARDRLRDAAAEPVLRRGRRPDDRPGPGDRHPAGRGRSRASSGSREVRSHDHRARDLTVRYGRTTAVDDLSLTLRGRQDLRPARSQRRRQDQPAVGARRVPAAQRRARCWSTAPTRSRTRPITRDICFIRARRRRAGVRPGARRARPGRARCGRTGTRRTPTGSSTGSSCRRARRSPPCRAGSARRSASSSAWPPGLR